MYHLEHTKQSYTFLFKPSKVLSSKLSTLSDQALSVKEKEVQSAVHLVGFVLMYPRASGLNMSKYTGFLKVRGWLNSWEKAL